MPAAATATPAPLDGSMVPPQFGKYHNTAFILFTYV